MLRLYASLLVFTLFMFTEPIVNVYASTIELSKTGQIRCYDTNGTELTCSATGQDGELQTGRGWPTPRFEDNGDSTITDWLTGLNWSKEMGGPTFDTCTGGVKTWQSALDYVACLNNAGYLGHNDWRLPNINEIESILKYDETNNLQWLLSNGFTNSASVPDRVYWTSTIWASNTGAAWYGYFIDDTMLHALGHSSLGNIWPVRSGQDTLSGNSIISLPRTGQTTSGYSSDDGATFIGKAWPEPRFSEGGEAKEDALTGLYWIKDAGTPTIGTCGGGKLAWQQALDYVKCLNVNTHLGFNDWRLPNVKELRSLVHHGVAHPSEWLTSQGFTNLPPLYDGAYWSSSSYPQHPNSAFYVALQWYGTVYEDNKTSANYVWPVRGQNTVAQNSDIAVALVNAPASVIVGQQITYNIAVTNNGPDIATDVSLTDTLPVAALFVSATAQKGSCNLTGGTVICNIGNLANGQTVSISLIIDAPNSVGDMTNAVSAICSDSDTDCANNSAIHTTSVLPLYVSLTKTGTGGGDIVSSPNGISCGTICVAGFDYGAQVTLTATTNSDSCLTGWNGEGCASTAPTCTLTVDTDKQVSATFDKAIKVASPNGAEKWIRGSTYTISWSYACNVSGTVRIELLKGGALNRTITTNAPLGSNGIGSYNWRIPNNQAVSSDYAIRVTATNFSTYSDTSDGNFNISK